MQIHGQKEVDNYSAYCRQPFWKAVQAVQAAQALHGSMCIICNAKSCKYAAHNRHEQLGDNCNPVQHTTQQLALVVCIVCKHDEKSEQFGQSGQSGQSE